MRSKPNGECKECVVSSNNPDNLSQRRPGELVITRRVLIKKCSYLSMLSCLSSGTAQQSRQPASLPPGIGTEPDYAGPLPVGRLGKRPALDPEERVARAVLDRAPSGPSPYSVAQYFLAVGQGQYGEEWRPYVSGWPLRWNPVIVNFFKATNTSPEGDTTPWCAAFVNWCFLQSRKTAATHSASSGSFRCFGSETRDPRPGDLVVFNQPDAKEKCIGHGHVGFFVRDWGEEIEVLGGNQLEGHERSHRVSTKRIRKLGGAIIMHSCRTDALLHG